MRTYKWSLNCAVWVLFVGIVLSLFACMGTREAYRAADDIEDYAYVLTEHYSAILHEAAMAKQSGRLTGDLLSKVQEKDKELNPIVLALKNVAESYISALAAYEKSRDAKDAVAVQVTRDTLQAEINNIVPLLADLLRLVKQAGSTSKLEEIDIDLTIMMVAATD